MVRVGGVGRALGALAVAALIASCGLAQDAGTSRSGGPDALAKELRLAIGGESDDGYDPTLGWGRYGSPLFQSTLLRRDENLKIVNDLATGYTVSSDGLVWRVGLRDDARFTNGDPVTAQDVAYTFTTAARAGGLADLTALKEAVAIDAHTVEMRLTQPQSTFVNRLVSLGIVPKKDHGTGYAQHPIGSGPFKFVQWDKGQQLIVERNDDYYGQRPAFARLVFVFSDEDASLAAAQAGQVEMAAVPSSLATTTVPGMTLVPVTSVDNRGVMFPYVPDTGRKTEKGYPIGNDVTSDRAIRQAVNHVVDRQALVDGVLEGFGSPASGPVDGLPWYEPRSSIKDNDAARARSLLDAAGWVDSNGDGVRERKGVDAAFTLIYPAADSLRQALALAVADMVKPVGIRVTTKGASWDVIDTRMHADAVMFGFGSHDPIEMYNLYSSDQAGVDYRNPGFYANKTVDAHLDAALHTTSETTALGHWRAAQLDSAGVGFSAPADAAWAWLVNLQHTYFVDDCLDIGTPQIEPHGHGWPITAGITGWRWRC